MKTIYELALHETGVIKVKSDTTAAPYLSATRVPGGWIYHIWDNDKQEYTRDIFVPYNDEFIPKDDEIKSETYPKTFTEIEGYLNRHITPIPEISCHITILKQELGGSQTYMCEWNPFNAHNYTPEAMPGEGYLGTAIVLDGYYKSIGFHAWQQNDSEFVYYKILR